MLRIICDCPCHEDMYCGDCFQHDIEMTVVLDAVVNGWRRKNGWDMCPACVAGRSPKCSQIG